MMTMMVEREELIVSPNVPTPPYKNRPARFLNPSLTNPDDPSAFDLPLSAIHVAQCRSRPPTLPPMTTVFFSGFRDPLKNWSDWVHRMLPLHRATWHKAGIYDPIIHSTYTIPIHRDLLLGLAHTWCPVTNTFVFLWGEATVTLEDVTVLGGYSVLGNSVLTTSQIEEVNDAETARINEVLTKVRADMNKSTSKKVTMGAWMKAFMGCGGGVEHVAFLVLWLSYYVFPFAKSVVGKHLHGIATHLARGIRVALAPAILACIYRDLTLLKQTIVQNRNKIRNKKKETFEVLNLWSPMQLVQAWAWERFPILRPQPIPRIEDGEPRIVRWSKVTVKGLELAKVRSAIESASGSFVWRPYADFKDEKCWQLHKFYLEKEKWVLVCPGMREEFKSFARIVRVSELVGINCTESYFPHRVSMQFGMDQDIPGRVARFGEIHHIAWKNYDRPIRDKKLYIPSRSYQSGVTSRYLEWWTQQKLVQKNNVKFNGGNKRKAMTELLKTNPISTSCSLKKVKAVVEDMTTPCFSPNSKKFKAERSVSCKRAAKMIKSPKKMGNDKRKPKKTGGNKVPDSCMSASGAALWKEIESRQEMVNDELILETIIDGKTIPDGYSSPLVAEYRMEMGNDKQTLEIMNDRNKIHNDCRSLCAELQRETRNNEQIIKRDDGLEVPDDGRLSSVACDDNDVRIDFPMEPMELFEITIAVCDETGNIIRDGGTLSPPAETRTHSSSLLTCNGGGQTDSYRKPTDVFENASGRGDETLNEIPDGSKLSSHAKPLTSSSSPLACNRDDLQMEFHLEPIEVLENTIPRLNESRNTMPDGDRLPQIQSSTLVCTGEQANACESTVATHDEAMVEQAVKACVSIEGDTGANINDNENQMGTSSNKMEKLRAMPLEDRITRLEILVAQLKAMGQRSI